jgi:hypothetical protein
MSSEQQEPATPPAYTPSWTLFTIADRQADAEAAELAAKFQAEHRNANSLMMHVFFWFAVGFACGAFILNLQDFL